MRRISNLFSALFAVICPCEDKGSFYPHIARILNGMRYIWELEQWPEIGWEDTSLSPLLAKVSRDQGRLLGKMDEIGFDLRSQAHLHTLTDDVIKSSEIEGEHLPRDQVRSSIARRLGLDVGGLVPAGREVEGVVEMMTDATINYEQPLTAERLFAWHAALFPTGRSGMNKIVVGWRVTVQI